MKLKGEHIELRLADVSDLEAIYSWENDPENWFVSGTTAPYTKDQIQHFLENDNDIFAANQCRFMLELGDERIGCVDLFEYEPKHGRVGVGVLVEKQFRGKGYAKEALQLLSDFCRQTLRVRLLYADVLSNNESSIKLFEAAGFKKSGVRKAWVKLDDALLDQHMFQLNLS